MKPIIGLSVQYSDDGSRTNMATRYMKALEMAGSVPILLPEVSSQGDIAAMARLCDGVLLSGGEDLDPALYGEDILPECGRVTASRDAFELRLLRCAMELRLPLMGICRGIQTLNVGLGGTLYQHIPNHRDARHKTRIYPGSILYSAVGSGEYETNSFHHQAVKRPAPGTEVLARAADGTVEAITLRDYPFLLGIQWHPEVSLVSEGDPTALDIFRCFTAACSAK